MAAPEMSVHFGHDLDPSNFSFAEHGILSVKLEHFPSSSAIFYVDMCAFK